jgi:SAM-dependent methyltransferase
VDLKQCFGETDSLSCYMLPVDALFLAVPLATGSGAIEAAAKRRILVVGENGKWEYSLKLREALGPEYHIVATSYETAEELTNKGLKIPVEAPGFEVKTGIDATNLGSHFPFPNEKFDTIIFNNPLAVKGWHPETEQLIKGTLQSAQDVLNPGGEVRFGMFHGNRAPGSLFFWRLTTPGNYGPYSVEKAIRFMSDEFGVEYHPMKSIGKAFNSTSKAMYWHRFLLSP